MNNPSRTYRAAGGFTLMEILTVIAIVALLVAVLLPVIRHAVDVSQQSRCMSGLRHLQMANLQYATDHNGMFVPIYVEKSNGSGKLWWHNNRDYATLLGCPENVSAKIPDDLRCPIEEVQQTGWGFNSTGYTERDNKRSIWQSELAHPSKSMAIIDALDFHVFRSKADAYYGVEVKIGNAVAYRHNDMACAVFWDGHTEVLTREEVLDNDDLWQQKSE